MPRYYFHVHGERFDAADLTGKDCPNLECAQKTAHRIAGELIMNSMVEGQVPMEITIAVEDEDLRPVLTLPLHEAILEVPPAPAPPASQ